MGIQECEDVLRGIPNSYSHSERWIVHVKLELYKIYRPTTLERVRGQDAAVRTIKSMIANSSIPHAILFTGPSGCGKTTLGRILKDVLECSDVDYTEVNGADDNGVDMVRGIRDKMRGAPINGRCRIWMIDECHMLSKPAQNTILKALEDTPPHVYFILATTDPVKLLDTIITRSTVIPLRALADQTIKDIVGYAARKERIELSDDVMERIVLHCEGSARKALVFLHQVQGLPEEDQLEAIQPSKMAAAAFSLYREMCNPKPQWAPVAKVLRELEEDPESVRRMILACARTSLLKEGGKFSARSYLMIDTFRDNLFNTGAAGLAAMCYELVTGVK